jgi:hypothetical protein
MRLDSYRLPVAPLPHMPGTLHLPDNNIVRGGIGLLRGSGLGATDSQINAIVTAGASTTVGLLAAFQVGVLAVPGVGAAVAGLIAVASLVVNFFQGCGQTCIATTADVNKAEPLLQQNLAAYLAIPAPRTQSMQAAGINNFTTVWNAVIQACSEAGLGTAGQNCISDRQQGACDYHTTPGGWQQDASSGVWTYQYPGANGSGTACWNWFIGYHDPIANDPTVVSDSTVLDAAASASSSSTSAVPSSAGGLSSSTFLYLALAAGALLLLGGGD